MIVKLWSKNEILYRPIVCVLMNVYIEKFSKLYCNVSRSMKKITKFRGEKMKNKKKNYSQFCFFIDKRRKYPVDISKPLYERMKSNSNNKEHSDLQTQRYLSSSKFNRLGINKTRNNIKIIFILCLFIIL